MEMAFTSEPVVEDRAGRLQAHNRPFGAHGRGLWKFSRS